MDIMETPILDLDTESAEDVLTPEEVRAIHETRDANREEAQINNRQDNITHRRLSVADTELDPDISHSPDSKTTYQRVEEDSDDPIDINMWTQPKSLSSPSDRPINSFQSRADSLPSAKHTSERVLYNAGSWARSESPDSIQEIPFTTVTQSSSRTVRQTSAQNPQSETITIASNDNKETFRSLLQNITLIEGSEQLRKLPRSLYNQFNAFCHLRGTTQPDIIKTKWPPPNSLFRSKAGAKAWFETPNGHPLLVARYSYGRLGQFIVVQDETKKFNHGNPAIITHTGTVVQGEKNGKTCSFYRWDVWDAFTTFEPHLWVNRVIEQGINTKAPVVNTVLKWQSDLSSKFGKPLANLQPAVSTKGDTFNASTSSKRPPPIEQPISQNKRSRTFTTITIDSSLLKAEYPRIDGCGYRRDVSTGEILLRRKSDGELIALRCPDCNLDRGIMSTQGFLNHMRVLHGRRYVDHDEMDEECGIVVTNAPPAPIRSDPNPQPSPVRTRTQPPRNTTQRLATPPKSVGPSEPVEEDDEDDEDEEDEEDEDHEPLFIFKKSKNDRNPRIRPLSSINSAEKLFVNALVAGVARKNTLMLTVTIEGDEPIHIVKNDKEDFENVLDQITNSKVAYPRIWVAAEDLDE